MPEDRFNSELRRPGDRFVPAHLQPLTLRAALRFATNMYSGLIYLGGIFALLAIFLGIAVAVLVWVEEMKLVDAVYFVAITALTIGYGDITPATLVGKTIAVATGLTGLLFTGIIIAVAVRALDHTVREQVARQRDEVERDE